MSHLMGELLPLQKVTIVARGQALGYTLNLPNEDRYLHTKEELIDLMKIALAGRAAEQVVFGRVTNGAANDLEKVTELARAMVFEYGMSESVTSRTMRADNYALSEETKRLRDSEQARLTDGAFAEAVRLLDEAPRLARPRRASAAREGDAGPRRDARAARRTWRPSRRPPRPSARRRAIAALSKRGLSSPADSIARVEARGIHHLGVAVEDLDEALRTYERLFGAQLEHRATVDDQGVAGRFASASAKAASSCSSRSTRTRPSAASSRSAGPGMHHVAYEVGDLERGAGRRWRVPAPT